MESEISANQFRYGRLLRIFFVFGLLFFPAIISAQQDEEPGANGLSAGSAEPVNSEPEAQIALIPCKGMIDDGLFKSIKRRSQQAIDNGADYLIFQIETYGGLLKSGDDIAKYFVLELGKKVRTVAYVTSEAISAGAMISVSCQDIIMLKNTTIGDCAPITMGGGQIEGVEREKIESFTRSTFERAAEANGYPEALLLAMVSANLEVFEVKNLETGQNEYFLEEDLPVGDIKYDVENKKTAVREGELLTLTADKAKEYGIAREVVRNFKGVTEFLSRRDGVIFSNEKMVLETLWSEEMVRWINSPAVMGVLVMVAFLGLYIELNTPGLGLPGLAALIAVVIIVGSKYLHGMANWIEVAVFIIGILLVLAEILVIPGFGIAGIGGMVFIVAGLFGMLVKNPPDSVPWPATDYGWDIFINGAAGMTAGFLGFTIIAYFITRYLPNAQFLSGLILTPNAPATPDTASEPNAHETPQQGTAVKTEVKTGDTGEVITSLRPVGEAIINGKVVDVVTQAAFIDKGQEIKVMEVHGNRIVVAKTQEDE